MHRRTAFLVAVTLGVLAAPRSFSDTRVWTGAASRYWSNPGNWSPAGALAGGDLLVFPPEVSNEAMTNDLPAGFAIGGAQFADHYTLDGNTLTVTGNITGGTGTWSAPLKLGGAAGIDTLMLFYGAIDVNGQTLTIGRATLYGPLNGTGSIVVTKRLDLSAAGDYSGTLQGPFITLAGATLPNMVVNVGLTGYGAVGTVTVPPHWELFPTGGDLHTKSLALNGDLLTFVGPSLFPLQVTGSVTLGGGSLFLTGNAPAVGQTITIIDNDGTDPVNGTFAGLPEHGVMVRDGVRFMVSYTGGDGNDVTVTVVPEVSVMLSQSAATSLFGEPLTLTATVTDSVGGAATFFADGMTLGTAAVTNGTASLVVATLDAGGHQLVAEYLDASSVPISHLVTPAPTTINVRPTVPVYVGSSPELTVTVAATTSPALRPDGTVEVSGAVVVGRETFADGSILLRLTPLPPGAHTLSVAYAGSSRFQPSSTTVVQTVQLPAVSVHGLRVREGDDGKTTVMVPVTLSAPVALPVRVAFSLVPGTAAEDVDYDRAGGVVNIAPGEQTVAVELHIIGDTAVEPDETFTIVISDPDNCTIETASALIVIENDDAPSPRKRAVRH